MNNYWLVSTITGLVSIFNFACKVCTITPVIKKYKSIIKKKIKKHDEIAFSAKTKLNTIEILISKALIDPNISYNHSFSVNGVLKEYYNMKETT